MKTIYSLFALVLLTSLAFANKSAHLDSNETKFTHYAGFNLGSSTGVGLTYGFLSGKFRVQTSILPIAEKDRFTYNQGFKFGYNLITKDLSAFYIYTGFNWIYSINKYPYTDYNYYYEEYSSVVIQNKLNNSFGLGMQFNAGSNSMFNLCAGYGLYSRFHNTLPNSFRIGIAGEISWMYKF